MRLLLFYNYKCWHLFQKRLNILLNVSRLRICFITNCSLHRSCLESSPATYKRQLNFVYGIFHTHKGRGIIRMVTREITESKEVVYFFPSRAIYVSYTPAKTEIQRHHFVGNKSWQHGANPDWPVLPGGRSGLVIHTGTRFRHALDLRLRFGQCVVVCLPVLSEALSLLWLASHFDKILTTEIKKLL